MQSLTRAISRGNAIIAFDPISKTDRPIFKRKTPVSYWKYSQKWRQLELEKQMVANKQAPAKSNKTPKHPHVKVAA